MNKTVLTSFTILCLLSTVFLIGCRISVRGSLELHVHNIDSGKNFSTIQEAINDNETLDGHTILVDVGMYYEHVVINKSITLIGEDRITTIVDGNKTGNVVRVVAENVCLRNFTIRNSRPRPPSPWWARGDSGIYLGGHSHNIIMDNMITNCYGGIEIVMSHNNTIENNHLSENSNFGICLHVSTGNIINDNKITDGSTAIFFDFGANRNRVNNNKMSNTGSGIDINFDCANNSLRNNKISSCTFGVSSYPCYNNTATGNTISNCVSGIDLRGSKNMVSKNNISYCEYGGVKIALSNFTVISGNLLTHNGMGIWIKGDHNIIFGNTLMSNNHGFDVRYCNNNTFYQNDVINNTIQAYLVDTINEWDKGYPSGGNYWSDYEGNDIKSGVYQNETGYDWIGDSQYVIDQNNSDRYPLMYPFIPEMEEIRISYRSLLLKYTEMNSTLHKQIGNITDLQEQIDSLNSTLQTSIDNLQDQIDSLNSTQTSSKEAIIDELSTIKNLMYVFIAATVILIATTVYLAIRKPKLISKTKAKKKG